MKTRREVVAMLMAIRDRMAEVGAHQCPGFDCATCGQSANLEEIDQVVAEMQTWNVVIGRTPRNAT